MRDQSESRRLETLPDGSAIIIGGCDFGGYVNDAGQNNPTFECVERYVAPLTRQVLAVQGRADRPQPAAHDSACEPLVRRSIGRTADFAARTRSFCPPATSSSTPTSATRSLTLSCVAVRANQLTMQNNIEHPLANTPHSVRTYPGSAATAMMPLTPANARLLMHKRR